MKKYQIKLLCLFVSVSIGCADLYAQDTAQMTTTKTDSSIGDDLKQAAKKTGKAIKKGAKKVSDKTAELSSKGAAALVDRVHKTKVGPAGETIYIKDDVLYYWIDDKGNRHYIKESELKDKP